MPCVDQLPVDLKELAYRNAVELTHPRWKSDVEVLVRALRPFMDPFRAEAADETERGETRAGSATRASGEATKGATVALTIDAQTMARVTKELAVFIGPIAEVVVKRAAKRCTSTRDLCTTVAQEIEIELDRAKFLRSCQN